MLGIEVPEDPVTRKLIQGVILSKAYNKIPDPKTRLKVLEKILSQ